MADRGFRSAGHADISRGFSVVKSAEQFPDSHQAPPLRQSYNVTCCLILKENARPISWTQIGSGPNLYVVAASQSNCQLTQRWPSTVSVFTQYCDVAHLIRLSYRSGVTLAQSHKQALSQYCFNAGPACRRWTNIKTTLDQSIVSARNALIRQH